MPEAVHRHAHAVAVSALRLPYREDARPDRDRADHEVAERDVDVPGGEADAIAAPRDRDAGALRFARRELSLAAVRLVRMLEVDGGGQEIRHIANSNNIRGCHGCLPVTISDRHSNAGKGTCRQTSDFARAADFPPGSAAAPSTETTG